MDSPPGNPADLVREMLAADARGDYDAALAAFDPEVDGDFTHLADGRAVHGRDGIRSEVARWRSAWSELETDYERVAAAGERVLVLVRQRGIGKGSGASMEMRYGQVYVVRDGLIASMKTYLDPEQAIKDAGADPTA